MLNSNWFGKFGSHLKLISRIRGTMKESRERERNYWWTWYAWPDCRESAYLYQSTVQPAWTERLSPANSHSWVTTPWLPSSVSLYHLVSFQIVNENVGQPQILHKLQIHRSQQWVWFVFYFLLKLEIFLLKWNSLWVFLISSHLKLGIYEESSLCPLNVEISCKSDAVVLIINS